MCKFDKVKKTGTFYVRISSSSSKKYLLAVAEQHTSSSGEYEIPSSWLLDFPSGPCWQGCDHWRVADVASTSKMLVSSGETHDDRTTNI